MVLIPGAGWRSAPALSCTAPLGRPDLKPGVEQPLNDDFGCVFGVKDLRWNIGAAEQVGEHVQRGELGRD
jgi:hypothetical protein